VTEEWMLPRLTEDIEAKAHDVLGPRPLPFVVISMR
jgi:hypothetical protein